MCHLRSSQGPQHEETFIWAPRIGLPLAELASAQALEGPTVTKHAAIRLNCVMVLVDISVSARMT
jgi:hypothetical protein